MGLWASTAKVVPSFIHFIYKQKIYVYIYIYIYHTAFQITNLKLFTQTSTLEQKQVVEVEPKIRDFETLSEDAVLSPCLLPSK